MRFDILTIFPEMVMNSLSESVIGRAIRAGIIEVNAINIRDFTLDKHKRTDDYPYSGGGGMIMTPQPIYDAYQSIASACEKKPHTIYLSPKGTVFNQQKAKSLLEYDHIVLLCGHYEGIDQRVIDLIVDEEISIGDFVLTGGELPAAMIVDSVSRMVPGVLAGEESFKNESHYDGLLEYPQYTRPPEFMGLCVPGILLSGDHAKIEKWKHDQSVEITKRLRPDMIERS